LKFSLQPENSKGVAQVPFYGPVARQERMPVGGGEREESNSEFKIQNPKLGPAPFFQRLRGDPPRRDS
jgi:hypothetical protein